MTAEINVFLNDGSLHVKYIVPDSLVRYDEEGEEQTELVTPDTVADVLKELTTALEGRGFTPSARKPGFAGRNERKETPPPEGMPVPEHCGAPCEFKPAFVSPKTQKQVSAKFQCRSVNCPTKAQAGWPWSIFVDKWMQEQNG